MLERLSRVKTLDEKTSGDILARKFCATRSGDGFEALDLTVLLVRSLHYLHYLASQRNLSIAW